MKPSELLSDESKWTKGAIARDNGQPCPFNIGECWCAIGAALYCDIDEVERARLDEVAKALFPDRVIGIFAMVANFNDHPDTTFEDVRRVLIEAGL
jgi:hypothetical protein